MFGIQGFNQVEHVIRILVAASPEYVNTYSTRRPIYRLGNPSCGGGGGGVRRNEQAVPSLPS